MYDSPSSPATTAPRPALLLWHRVGLLASVLATYVLVFTFGVPHTGPVIAALSAFPVAAAGWLLGWRAGLLAGLASVPLNAMLFHLVADTPIDLGPRLLNPGSLVALALGTATGWVKGLLNQLRTQAQLLVRERAELQAEIAERIRAEAAWQASERSKAALMDVALDGIILMDHMGIIIELNRAAEQIFGYPRAAAEGRDMAELIIPPEVRAQHRAGLAQYLTTGAGRWMNTRTESMALHADGRTFPVEVAITRVPTAEPPIFIGFVRDLSERRSLEAQLLQAQKLESIGRLAGGIAHDFNNLLTALIGYLSLAEAELPPGTPSQLDVAEARKVAERAATLTRQLLTFARQQVIIPRVVDLNELVQNLSRMLERLLGAQIRLELQLAPDLWPVRIDSGQFEQVLVNLAINARDAMIQGGTLTIATSIHAMLGRDGAHTAETLRPGQYVRVAVRDSGSGMPPEVLSQVFEPFFTTKPTGQGTGLGLAICYGIITQHGGTIRATSRVGQGTTMTILIPCADEPSPVAAPALQLAPPRGTETVLLVDDDDAVRALAARVLRQLGYRLLEATDGPEALRLAAVHGEAAIDLLVTDLMMPQMRGTELIQRLRQRKGQLKALLISGNADSHRPLQQSAGAISVLAKPFTPAALAQTVRAILDTTPSPANGEC